MAQNLTNPGDAPLAIPLTVDFKLGRLARDSESCWVVAPDAAFDRSATLDAVPDRRRHRRQGHRTVFQQRRQQNAAGDADPSNADASRQ